jgi:hypothetical protein
MECLYTKNIGTINIEYALAYDSILAMGTLFKVSIFLPKKDNFTLH